jgi:hypothetical protein
VTGRNLGVADHAAIVCDEVVAFLFVLYFVGADMFLIGVAFFLFRFFDIAKPPPIRQLDRAFKNGFGVMVDDLAAAGYTLLALAVWRALRGFERMNDDRDRFPPSRPITCESRRRASTRCRHSGSSSTTVGCSACRRAKPARAQRQPALHSSLPLSEKIAYCESVLRAHALPDALQADSDVASRRSSTACSPDAAISLSAKRSCRHSRSIAPRPAGSCRWRGPSRRRRTDGFVDAVDELRRSTPQHATRTASGSSTRP